MGIKNLWNSVKPYTRDGHLGQFEHQKVAIDMYVWLHMYLRSNVTLNMEQYIEFLHTDAAQLSQSTPSTPSSSSAALSEEERMLESWMENMLVLRSFFLDGVINRVAELRKYGVTPVCVFDGCSIPLKGNTEAHRRRRRLGNFRAALAALQPYSADIERLWGTGEAVDREAQTDKLTAAKKMESIAAQASRMIPRVVPPAIWDSVLTSLSQAFDVTTELAAGVMDILRKDFLVECIVAPFEADAQLSYLCRTGYVAACISIDSDLIAYNCPCIIKKIERDGRCVLLEPPKCMSLLMNSAQPASPKSTRSSKSLSSPASTPPIQELSTTSSFRYDSFLVACILSGCDYLENIPSIGIRKALKLVVRCASISELSKLLQEEVGLSKEAVKEYLIKVYYAFYAFSYHIVYSPSEKRVVHLRPVPSQLLNLSVLEEGALSTPSSVLKPIVGERWEAEVAINVCERLTHDPLTLEPYMHSFESSCVAPYRVLRLRAGQTRLDDWKAFQKCPKPVPEAGKRIEEPVSGSPSQHSSSQSEQLSWPVISPSRASLQPFCGRTGMATERLVRSRFAAIHSSFEDEVWVDSDSEEGEVMKPSSVSSPLSVVAETALAVPLKRLRENSQENVKGKQTAIPAFASLAYQPSRKLRTSA